MHNEVKQKNSSIEIEEISYVNPVEWDKIVNTYPDHTVYHLSCWHHVLEDCFNGIITRFKILNDGELCGYWCGIIIKKFGIKIFGSPTAATLLSPLASIPVAPELRKVIF